MGYDIEDSTHVFLDDDLAVNHWGNSYFFVNDVDLHGTNLGAYYGQDADYEMSTYDGQSIADGHDATLSNITSYGSFSCILVNSYQNVTVDGFVCGNTWNGGVTIRQDNTTTTAYWPDRIKISDGVIYKVGALNPSNNSVGLSTLPNSTTPAGGTVLHFGFSNISVDTSGVSDTATSVSLGIDATHSVNMDAIRVTNATGDCFDLFSGYLSASHLSCDHAQQLGIYNGTSINAVITGSTINDAYLAASSTIAFQNVATGTLNVSGLTLTSDQTTSRQLVYDGAATGYHVWDGSKYFNTDGNASLFQVVSDTTSYSNNMSLNGAAAGTNTFGPVKASTVTDAALTPSTVVCAGTAGLLTSTCPAGIIYFATSHYWTIAPTLFATAAMLGPVFYQGLPTNGYGSFAVRMTGTISCSVAPVIQLMDLGTSPSTVYGSATSLASITTGTSDGVYVSSSPTFNITSGHFVGIAFSAGTCVTAPTFDISGNW